MGDKLRFDFSILCRIWESAGFANRLVFALA